MNVLKEPKFKACLFFSPTIQRLNENPLMRSVFWLTGKAYLTFFLPHCFLPFGTLTMGRFIPALKTTYGLVYVFFGAWPLWKPLAKMILKPVRPEKKDNWKHEKKLNKKIVNMVGYYHFQRKFSENKTYFILFFQSWKKYYYEWLYAPSNAQVSSAILLTSLKNSILVLLWIK